MVDTAFFVKSTRPRALIGSFQHFADIYFSKSVFISFSRGIVWDLGYLEYSTA